MFRSRFHSVGNAFSVETPVPDMPLHCGQFSGEAAHVSPNVRAITFRIAPPVSSIITRNAGVVPRLIIETGRQPEHASPGIYENQIQTTESDRNLCARNVLVCTETWKILLR